MKTIILVSILIVFAFAEQNEYGIGQSCDSTTPFVVSNFAVDPFPPTAGVQMNVNMYGTFSKDTYVSDISVRTRLNGGAWSYKYIDVGQTFKYGQVYTFAFPVTAGSTSGLYETQVRLESKEGSPFSCWDFSYHIA
ncbi:hypothetical protein SteCoe_16602 [Stentor coeruleus]|uniref:MD-2-related lipid-recognition domain-containing protein n=1 Tax=Stentor coeruleus TaxID=5963 RepID=A0A1R2C0T2_9CILI|nr:hypothetical protein SteCoe_16602 [Stentor coeruleus]